MTDLTQALVELRRVTPPSSPWEAGDFGVGSSPVDYHIATILNAVLSGDLIPVQCCMCGKTGLSIREGDGGPECQLDDGRWTCSRECWDRATGDLIPRADADLVVALMVEKARSLCKTQAGLSKTNDYDLAWCRCAGYLEYEILTLTPASALAELQALRAERDDAVASQFITRVERDGAEDHATETADELRQVRARAEAAEADITTYLRIVADMTQEAEAAEAELVTLRAQVERLTDLIQWAHDTLWELNPSNYGHDDVCKVNDAAVEVILGLAPVIGETHGHSAEWWATRAALTEGAAP